MPDVTTPTDGASVITKMETHSGYDQDAVNVGEKHPNVERVADQCINSRKFEVWIKPMMIGYERLHQSFISKFVKCRIVQVSSVNTDHLQMIGFRFCFTQRLYFVWNVGVETHAWDTLRFTERTHSIELILSDTKVRSWENTNIAVHYIYAHGNGSLPRT